MRADVADTKLRLAGGIPLAGFPVGILCLSTKHPLMPGNMQHANSFGSPVIYHVLELSDPWPLMRGEPWLWEPILDGVRQLAGAGVRAVVGACGSFAYYQKAVAGASPVPVFLSIMTQVPFLLQALPADGRLGVICAVKETMNERVFEQCGIAQPERLLLAEMRGGRSFDAMIDDGRIDDVEKLRGEVIAKAKEIACDPSVKAILLQCSELPPFGSDVQQHTNLPIFDMVRLTRWLISACDYQTFAGMQAHRLAQWP